MPLPIGYRQGFITAITVVLGFSLVFLRIWGFELPGEWDVTSTASAILLGILHPRPVRHAVEVPAGRG